MCGFNFERSEDYILLSIQLRITQSLFLVVVLQDPEEKQELDNGN